MFIPLQHCIMALCNGSHSELGLQLLVDLLTLKDCSYWLVRTELLETLAEIDFRWEHVLGFDCCVYITSHFRYTGLSNHCIWSKSAVVFVDGRLVSFLERKTEKLHKGEHHYTGVRLHIVIGLLLIVLYLFSCLLVICKMKCF